MNNNYNCAQSELYSVCKVGWKSNLEYLPDFTALKGKYDAQFNATKVQAIKDAEKLPSEAQRKAQAEKYRITLAKTNTLLCDHFQTLKLYIVDAFAPEYHESHYKEAGILDYPEAYNKNWDKSAALANSIVEYVDKYKTDLTANLNMPANFEQTGINIKSQFDNQYQTFMDEVEASKVATQTKIVANNALYSDLIAMFKDGQQIFNTNQAVLDQFVFETVLHNVTNTQATVKAKIEEEGTLHPIPEAIIELSPGEDELITDINGKAEEVVAAGFYTVRVSHPLYVTKVINDFEVKTSQGNTLNVKLTQSAPPPPPPPPPTPPTPPLP